MTGALRKQWGGHTLPIPLFTSIKETQTVYCRGERFALIYIVPDIMAGKRHRYTVLKIRCLSGRATVHGRELPLKHAREIVLQVFHEESSKR